jgi:hypothetical protein
VTRAERFQREATALEAQMMGSLKKGKNLCFVFQFGPDKSDKKTTEENNKKTASLWGYLVVLRWRH